MNRKDRDTKRKHTRLTQEANRRAEQVTPEDYLIVFFDGKPGQAHPYYARLVSRANGQTLMHSEGYAKTGSRAKTFRRVAAATGFTLLALKPPGKRNAALLADYRLETFVDVAGEPRFRLTSAVNGQTLMTSEGYASVRNRAKTLDRLSAACRLAVTEAE